MKITILVTVLMVLLAACASAKPTITDNGSPGQIKFLVFQDTNGNGTKDSDEAGFSERVILSQNDTCPPQRKDFRVEVTDANGEYLFTDLAPGTYCAAYYGGQALTTQIAVKVPLSSEQVAQVQFGVLP
jgi:uncharacterized protein (DUF2141 family)